MHPIERLRYVARAAGADPALLAEETADALVAFVDDPAQVVLACRRILDRHPTVGPLWWLCSRVLLAADLGREAFTVLHLLQGDGTPDELRRRLAEAGRDLGAAPPMVVEATMIGPDTAFVLPGTTASATGAAEAGSPIWLVGGVGRPVPAAVVEAVRDRLARRPRTGRFEATEELRLTLVDEVVGPVEPDFTPAPELLRG